jgi:mannose-6-phosphate isomerase
MNSSLYPLIFQPIFKERIWGGTKLKTILHKSIPSDMIGESWELSAVEGDVSIVANGEFTGKLLTELIDLFPEELLGTQVYNHFGKQFPLLFKYLDAKQDLSIQVHPNDELAQERHNSFGKTEMWYVMQADQDAKLIVGFKEQSNPKDYLRHLQNSTLLSILNVVNAEKGDVFLVETGTVHALGAGLLIAEIQQTSDITYRLYDFDRIDAHGDKRQLHVDLAMDAINYARIDAQMKYDTSENIANLALDCTYFTTNFLPLNGKMTIHKNGNSFTVLMCVDGNFKIEANGEYFQYKKGDTVLIPASVTDFNLDGKASVLEIYIK